METVFHPVVRDTLLAHYELAVDFLKVPHGLAISNIQGIRAFAAFNMVMLLTEQAFSGPSDILLNFAYLNVWSYSLTFLAALIMFKSANYETEVAAGTVDGLDSALYKRFGLLTLQAAHALNIVNAVGFGLGLYPNSDTAYSS